MIFGGLKRVFDTDAKLNICGTVVGVWSVNDSGSGIKLALSDDGMLFRYKEYLFYGKELPSDLVGREVTYEHRRYGSFGKDFEQTISVNGSSNGHGRYETGKVSFSDASRARKKFGHHGFEPF